MDNIIVEEQAVNKKGLKSKVLTFYYTGLGYKKQIGQLKIKLNAYEKGFRIFSKVVDSTKHKLRLFNAYGIQKEVFDKYLRGKTGKIIILEKDTDTYLKADIDTWTKNAVSRNYGEGKQVFLSLKFMEVFKIQQ